MMLFIKTAGFGDLNARLEHEVQAHKGKYIFQGIIFILGGILAAALPTLTAMNMELLIGLILLVTGACQLIFTKNSQLHGWPLLSALLSIVVGTLMLWKPMGVLMAVVTLMAIFMTIEGLLEIITALQWRPFRYWGWMLFSGVVTLALAIALWVGFPTIGIMYLGWVIAINLVLYGFSLLMLVGRFSGGQSLTPSHFHQPGQGKI